MSSRFRLQDATGDILMTDNINRLLVRRTTTPAGSESGYDIGCIWINTSGTVGTILYVNVGTGSSATWLNIA